MKVQLVKPAIYIRRICAVRLEVIHKRSYVIRALMRTETYVFIYLFLFLFNRIFI